jgi:diguanylate cyclase (GGDEF)-like protein
MNDRHKRRWLIEFGVVSLVPIIVLGLIVAQSMRSSIRDRAIDRAEQESVVVSKLAIEPQLAPPDMDRELPHEKRARITTALTEGSLGRRVVQVSVRNRAGRVIYSTDDGTVGRTAPPTLQSKRALEGHVAAGPQPDGEGGRVVATFVPLHLPGDVKPAGVASIWTDYAPVAAAVADDSRRTLAILVAGLSALWLGLVAVTAAASQRLRKQAADREHQALSDALTGLPNRTMFHDLVQRTILAAQRKKKLVSVMLMDLDRFKEVNDTLGHHNGDLLLQRIAQRLQGVLRDGETIARLGGDEFAILIPGVPDRQACVHVAKRLLKTLEEPVVVGGLALQCEGSIGIAIYPDHGKQVEAIMRAADVAMYVTKEQRSGHEFYDAALHEHRHDAGRLALVGELRRAMDEAELVLHYQPKVDLQSGKVKGVEALARWNHPERGLLSPDEFIPLAERSNLLRPMTVYLLDTALRQCNAWRARGLDVSVAVNLSMQNLLDLRLPNDIARLLTSWRLPPGSLELEITESTIMSDHRRAMSILTRLNKMGVTLSIDDFGTGYSSLAYLQELPVSAVKIDKSFVLTMDSDPGNATIVQSTIDLGHNLGLKVIAEGVETERCYGALARMGCDYAQGFFLSKPLSPQKMGVWLDVFMSSKLAAGEALLDETAPAIIDGSVVDAEADADGDSPDDPLRKEWVLG